MPYPLRFVVCTYNLWNAQRWPERQESLGKFLEYHLPDILCVQELRPVTREFLDAVLETHQRVEDPFEGWFREGNLWARPAIRPHHPLRRDADGYRQFCAEHH